MFRKLIIRYRTVPKGCLTDTIGSVNFLTARSGSGTEMFRINNIPTYNICRYGTYLLPALRVSKHVLVEHGLSIDDDRGVLPGRDAGIQQRDQILRHIVALQQFLAVLQESKRRRDLPNSILRRYSLGAVHCSQGMPRAT